MSKASSAHRLPAAVISAAGALLLFSLVLAAVSRVLAVSFWGAEVLLWPGRFLLAAFSWAAFYAPVYLFLNAVVLIRFTGRRIILLLLTLIPFLTLTLLFRTIFDSAEATPPLLSGLRAFLGPAGSGVALGAYTAMEIILILVVGVYSGRRDREKAPPEAGQTAGVIVKGDQASPKKTVPPAQSVGPRAKAQGGNGGSVDGPVGSVLPPAWKKAPPVGDADGAAEDDELIEPDEPDDIEMKAIPANGRGATEGPKAAPAPAVRERERKSAARYRIKMEDVLKDYGKEDYHKLDAVTKNLSETLKATLEEFNIQAEVTGIQKGPVITMFEILPAPGVKLSKIVNLADNIALRLAASRVRIVAPIPGKQAVGIEVPNKRRAIVSLKETISGAEFLDDGPGLPIALGKDIMGNIQVADLTQMPHLLIAGATGSGKSVCVNSIICSILFKKSPAEARLILIDPKIVELKYYNDIPHLLTPVITEPKKAFQALQYCIAEMERRYSLLDALCVRDIAGFNVKAAKRTHTTEPLPHIIVVIDEFADLIAVTGKDLESTLARLAAMSRAVGIHIVLATQRPSIDVITGLIKANIPSRIAFMVAGKFDSRIIIDQVGAEKLLGQGDMLFLSAQNPFPVRIQGAFISDREVEALVEQVKAYGEPDYIDDEIFIEEEEGDFDIGLGEADPMFDKALEIVLAAGKASTSYVQRKLKIGYNRAARLVEEMEIRGIVGPANGSKARDIVHVPSKARE